MSVVFYQSFYKSLELNLTLVINREPFGAYFKKVGHTWDTIKKGQILVNLGQFLGRTP